MFFRNLLDKIFHTGYFEPTGILEVPVGTVCCKLTIVNSYIDVSTVQSYITVVIDQRSCV